MRNFDLLVKKLLSEALYKNMPDSKFTSADIAIPEDVIWRGVCNNACKGAWTSVDPSNLEEVKRIIDTAGEYWGEEIYGDQTELLYNVPQYDNNDNEIHNHYSLKCYLSRTVEEFQKILEKNKFVRFYDGEWFNIFSKDKKLCKKEIKECLYAMDGWLISGAGDY